MHQYAQDKEHHQGDNSQENGDTLMQLNEQDLTDIDLEKLEEGLNHKDLHSIPIEQVRKVHKVFIDSTTGSTARVGIAIDPALD